MRVQALRVSETLYKAGDKSFAADYRRLARDTDPDVAAHALLTLNVLKVPDAAATIRQVAAVNKAAGVAHVANTILTAPAESAAGGNTTVNRTPAELARLGRGHGDLPRDVRGVPRHPPGSARRRRRADDRAGARGQSARHRASGVA